MRSPSLLGSVVLVLHFLCGTVLSHRLPVDEIFRKELQKKDLNCTDDDALLAFQQYSEDSVPFCSSYLGIPVSTSAIAITGRATVTTTTIITTGIDVDDITVPTGTTTVIATANPVGKRQVITPASVIIAAYTESPLCQSLISTVSSACSCLTITPSVLVQTGTVTITRTLTEIDYREGTISGTDFDRITTTLTVVPSRANFTTVTVSGSIVTSSISVPLSPSNTITIASPSNSVGLTSPLPTSTASSGSSNTLGSAVSSGPPVASINSTASTSSSVAVVTSIFTSTAPGAPSISTSTTSPLPSLSGPPRSAPTIPSSSPAVPIGSVNSTAPTSGISTSTGLSVSSSSIPTGSSNSTPTSTSPASSTASLPSLGGVCPVENGTYYTTHGQTFLINCYENFPGPATEGLDEPDLYACINYCAEVNLGFSQNNCYAASYFPNTLDGQNCFLKDKQNSQNPYTDYLTISAVLISGLSNVTTNATSGASATLSPSGGIPISTNRTINPTVLTSVNITSLPSVTSSVSFLTTSSPSGASTISSNSSSPTVTTFPQPSASNRSGFLSSTGSSGFPTPSFNSSSTGLAITSSRSIPPTVSTVASGSLPISFNSSSTGSRIVSASSGVPAIPANSSSGTIPPFASPSVSDRTGTNVTSSPYITSGIPSISSFPSLVMPVASENKTTGVPATTNFVSPTPSGIPTISPNVTAPPFNQPTNPLSRNSSYSSGTLKCIGCSHTTVITSLFTTIWTTTIVETSTSGVVVTHYFANRVEVFPTSTPSSQKRAQAA